MRLFGPTTCWSSSAGGGTLVTSGGTKPPKIKSPPFVLNVAGPELLSVRRVCEAFARLMNKAVKFIGVESTDALISNGQLGHRLFGYPRVSAQRMMGWIAEWVMSGGSSLGKPTHFETRDGRY